MNVIFDILLAVALIYSIAVSAYFATSLLLDVINNKIKRKNKELSLTKLFTTSKRLDTVTDLLIVIILVVYSYDKKIAMLLTLASVSLVSVMQAIDDFVDVESMRRNMLLRMNRIKNTIQAAE